MRRPEGGSAEDIKFLCGLLVLVPLIRIPGNWPQNEEKSSIEKPECADGEIADTLRNLLAAAALAKPWHALRGLPSPCPPAPVP